jgi:hypothetical protein
MRASRRSFLQFLGIGAVAAPVAVKATAASLPDMKGRINVGRDDFGPAGGGLLSGDGSHTHMSTPPDGSHTHTISYSPIEGEMMFCYDGRGGVKSVVWQAGAWVDTVPQFPMHRS